MQVRRWTVEIERGAGGRYWRGRQGGRYGELANWKTKKREVGKVASALDGETSDITRRKTYHEADQFELLEEAK